MRARPDDPIVDSLPHKRRKLDHERAWDSNNDSGDEITAEDLEPRTVGTVPLGSQVGKDARALQFTPSQLHKNLGTHRAVVPNSSSQTDAATLPTQPLLSRQTPPLPSIASQVHVPASSPLGASSPSKPAVPQPAKRMFAPARTGLLASAMAPAGTSFRRPANAQPNVPVINLDDDESDPPVVHSSEDENTQRLGSNLKPTQFKRSQAPGSTPGNHTARVIKESPRRIPGVQAGAPSSTSGSHTTRVVKESPRRPPGLQVGGFSDLMREFNFRASSSSQSQPANDLTTASASSSRPRKPQVVRPQPPSRTLGESKVMRYAKVEDIGNLSIERKVEEMLDVNASWTVDLCMIALDKKKHNTSDAISYLFDTETADVVGSDPLMSGTPALKRGMTMSKHAQQKPPMLPAKPTAKQEVKTVTKSIAEKWNATQPTANRPVKHNRAEDDDDADFKPRKRLMQGKKATRRSPTPQSSPIAAAPPQRAVQSKSISISDDEEEYDQQDDEDEEATSTPNDHEATVLKFFNECSVRDLADISAQPEATAQLIVDKRPFESLDDVRAVSTVTETKSGKKSRARPIGDKIVEVCSDMWEGYEAVDELVEECKILAKPIQEALKGWGVGSGNDGELHLMNLDEPHDSGIGTPSSSCPSDDPTAMSRGVKDKLHSKRFLEQPKSMNPEMVLKDYQLVGLNWLSLLWSKKLSCILADDMGIGKTCQVISFLAHLQEQKVDGIHLVVVPGSTLENWLKEFARFAPNLKVFSYYGSKKDRPELQLQLEEDFDTIDVVVTTYETATGEKSDRKFLKNLDPMVCVFDEAHSLRNPNTKRYEELMQIPADFRVLLTGTPLQNNLQELIAILAFIMPKLFARKADTLKNIFKYKATTKDANHAALLSAQRIARARSMMTPFILRRKKEQVLELPTKHRRIEFCDMTGTQANHYADLLEEAQAAKRAAEVKGSKKKSMSNVLMSLRQAAIHPLLSRRIYNDATLDKIVVELLKHDEYAGNSPAKTKLYLQGKDNANTFEGSDYALHSFCTERPYLQKFALRKKQWLDSGKVAALEKLVTQFAANGDRVLVFSQFTTVMNILEAVLETHNIKFMRLDGSTSMQIRQDMIDQFTHDTSITVFMLSTRAGGAGINLAAANKVVIFDSGFNPQDDIQAENRAHRVGQTREVEVVRLVTRHTIEEQIHALGESKLALDERVAGDVDGEKLVEKMLFERPATPPAAPAAVAPSPPDLKDSFKNGLQAAGVEVASK